MSIERRRMLFGSEDKMLWLFKEGEGAQLPYNTNAQQSAELTVSTNMIQSVCYSNSYNGCALLFTTPIDVSQYSTMNIEITGSSNVYNQWYPNQFLCAFGFNTTNVIDLANTPTAGGGGGWIGNTDVRTTLSFSLQGLTGNLYAAARMAKYVNVYNWWLE